MRASRRWLVASLLVGLVLASPAPAGAASAITLEVIVGQSCVSGTGPARTAHVATLRTPSGAFRGRFRARSDRYGDWSGCFPFSTSTYINGGDRLRIVAGNSARRLVVPRLEPKVNRVSDVISGSTRRGAEVFVLVTHLLDFRRTSDHRFMTTADANGRYRVDATRKVDLRGGDVVYVSTALGPDLFGALATVPHIQVTHGNNVFRGSMNNGTNLRLTVRNPNGVTKGYLNTGPIFFGLFEVAMFRPNGRAVYPVTGDTVLGSFAVDARLRMPVSGLRASAADDTVSGRCMPRAPYELWAGVERFTGVTDTGGRLQRNVSRRVNLRRGDEVELVCMYPTGDLWVRSAIAN